MGETTDSSARGVPYGHARIGVDLGVAGQVRIEMRCPESSWQKKCEATNNKRIGMFAHWCGKILTMVLL